jgi:hypothetical protein
MNDEKDYEQTYREFWAPILDAPDVDREDQIRRELHDYSFLMDEVPLVYDHVSGNRISKPNTMAFEVINQHDEVFVNQGCVADDLRALVRDASDFDELKKLVGDYAHDLDPGAA